MLIWGIGDMLSIFSLDGVVLWCVGVVLMCGVQGMFVLFQSVVVVDVWYG